MTRVAAPTILALVLALVLATGAAYAEDNEPAPAAVPARVRLEGTVGVGTPVGWAGAQVVGRIHPAFTVHAGAGFASQGPHVAAGARARVSKIGARDAVSLGASWSSGELASVPSSMLPFPEMGSRFPRTYYWERAHFANLDVNAEHDEWLRSFVGLGFVVNGGDYVAANRCSANASCSVTLARLVPYFGLAFSFGVL